jgi:hypothetical protein
MIKTCCWLIYLHVRYMHMASPNPIYTPLTRSVPNSSTLILSPCKCWTAFSSTWTWPKGYKINSKWTNPYMHNDDGLAEKKHFVLHNELELPLYTKRNSRREIACFVEPLLAFGRNAFRALWLWCGVVGERGVQRACPILPIWTQSKGNGIYLDNWFRYIFLNNRMCNYKVQRLNLACTSIKTCYKYSSFLIKYIFDQYSQRKRNVFSKQYV